MDLVVAKRAGIWGGRFGSETWRCAIGRGGVRRNKREGDGATPAGTWPLRSVLYRSDRGIAPETSLSIQVVGENDGWCDDPDDRHYNRQIVLPYPARSERLWRDDAIYDIVVILGHNDDPPVPGKGSAIFLHVARPDYGPTEGCVALAELDLRHFLRLADAATGIRIEL